MSREAQLSLALQEAWAELERKQTYIQNAFDSANLLQIELDQLKAANADAANSRTIFPPIVNDGASGDPALQTALHSAWAELERKQIHIQNAFDSAKLLQIELDHLKAANAAAENSRMAYQPIIGDATSGDSPLQTALNDAWAELAKKQQFLESSFEEIRARDAELAVLRQQIGNAGGLASQSGGLLQPNVEAALKQAWNDLEARDLLILELNAAAKEQNERIEWLLLENKTLANAIGVDKMRQ